MTTFDYNQVRSFADGVSAKLDACENGEGMQCDSIDRKLVFIAEQCCEFGDALLDWVHQIFTGQVAYDAAAEQLWIAELHRLIQRAEAAWIMGRKAEVVCFQLDGRAQLGAILWHLTRLKSSWVTPKLSVGPSARRRLTADLSSEKIQARIGSLNPHPKNWKPRDVHQATRYNGIVRT